MKTYFWRAATAGDIGRLARFWDRVPECPEFGLLHSISTDGKFGCQRIEKGKLYSFIHCEVQEDGPVELKLPMSHRNTPCKTCGKEFHWCSSCSVFDKDDMASDNGYCSWACVPNNAKQEVMDET